MGEGREWLDSYRWPGSWRDTGRVRSRRCRWSHGLWEGHLGGTAASPHPTEMSLHLTHQHTHCFTCFQFESSFANKLYRPFGFWYCTVSHFVDAACGSLRIHLSGGPPMLLARSSLEAADSPLSHHGASAATSPADSASPSIFHISCCLSTPSQAAIVSHSVFTASDPAPCSPPSTLIIIITTVTEHQ